MLCTNLMWSMSSNCLFTEHCNDHIWALQTLQAVFVDIVISQNKRNQSNGVMMRFWILDEENQKWYLDCKTAK